LPPVVGDRNIREKHDAVNQFPETNVKAGYAAHVVGFGWTNSVSLSVFKRFLQIGLITWCR
jgi:neutral trehalase